MKRLVAAVAWSTLTLSMGIAADVPALIKSGDALDAMNRNPEALELYLQADASRPDDAEILQRIANQYSQMISEMPTHDENVRIGKLALQFAERAVELAPASSDAHLTLAICYGRVALLESPRERLEYSKKIQSEAEAAVELNPQNDFAWHVLGRWNYELATLNPALRVVAELIFGKFPDASLERAAECFEKAIAVGPARVIHHVELGRTYLALGRIDEGRAQLKTGLELPNRKKDDSESKVAARKALDSI
jgi:tetratricopeptide (TPR) repeat protein